MIFLKRYDLKLYFHFLICQIIAIAYPRIRERFKKEANRKRKKSDCERKCLYTKLITTQKSESCFCLISLIDFEPSQQPKRTMMKKYIENIILLSHKDSSILELKKVQICLKNMMHKWCYTNTYIFAISVVMEPLYY